MRKLYYVRQFATGQSAFIAANNKSQVVELMNHNGLCGKGDRIELIGRAYGHTLKKLTKPTMFDCTI